MIRRLYVHNLRSLENFEMKFTPGQPTVLMGANGAGKSSVGGAFEWVRAAFAGALGGVTFHEEERDDQAVLELDVEIEGKNYSYKAQLGASSVFLSAQQLWDEEFLAESLFVDGEPIYTRNGLHIESSAGSITLDESLQGRSTLRFEPQGEAVRRYFNRGTVISPVPFMMGGNTEVGTDAHAGWIFEVASEFIAQSTKNAVGFLQLLKDMIPGVEDYQSQPGQPKSLVFKGLSKSKSVPVAHLSDGEKILFLAAYLISSARAGQSDFLFWDEPESFLAKSELQRLMRLLVDAYKDRQLIICTHDAEVANVFDRDHVLWFYRDQGIGPTRYKKLSELTVGGALTTRLALGDLDPA